MITAWVESAYRGIAVDLLCFCFVSNQYVYVVCMHVCMYVCMYVCMHVYM